MANTYKWINENGLPARFVDTKSMWIDDVLTTSWGHKLIFKTRLGTEVEIDAWELNIYEREHDSSQSAEQS